MLHVIHITGSRTGGVDRVEGDRALLGRDPAAEVRFHAVHDREVGKRHAELVARDGRFMLRDLSSRNGTYVNGRLVREVFLRQGDVIRLGADGPQVRIDLTGKDVNAVLGAMHRKRWRVVWVPVVLLLLAGAGLVGLWAVRQWDRRVDTLSGQKAELDGEIDALLAVLDSGEAADDVDAVGSRYDRMVELEAEAAELAVPLDAIGDGGTGRAAMDARVDAVLSDLGEPTYRVPRTFRDAVRAQVGAWLGTGELDATYCAAEANMAALRTVLARYNFPAVLAFQPWVLGAFGKDGKYTDAGPWGIGEVEGRELGLIDGETDRRADAMASTEAIAARMQRDLEALGTDSILLATMARDPQVASTVERLRERGAWTRERRTVRFLWLAGLLDEGARDTMPSLVAAAVVGRHPDEYGLGPEICETPPASAGDDLEDPGGEKR